MPAKHPFWRTLTRLCLSLGCVLLVGAGCETSDYPRKSGKNLVTASDNHGYALLAGLCGDEKDISKLRFFKSERLELKALLQEIAETNRLAYETLQKFAKATPALNLKDMGLPATEVAAREAIGKFKEKAILSSKGKDLEIQLLLAQSEALTYGAHLASVIAQTEPDSQRRVFLDRLAVNLKSLQQKVIGLLSSGYRP